MIRLSDALDDLAKERAKVEREIAAWLRTQIPVPTCRTLADRVERGDYRETSGYPADWPKCPWCERPALDGHLTCGEVNCAEGDTRNGATFKLRAELLGRHVHADLFVGYRVDALANAGKVVMHVPEWQCFESALVLGARRVPWGRVVVVTDGPLSRRFGA